MKQHYFTVLAEKNRTGIGVALILSSLNVSQELILEDYLKTNEGLKNSDKVSMEQYKKAGLSAEKIDQLEEMSKADPTYLEAAFNKIKSEYGNLDNYFTKGLGLPADFKEQMMKLYTILA
ncbi:tyrosine-protein phosphatase [Vagococcus jeotgali]|uniref:tyrosine-protein phosphatase n=1 Tax=Vagococcus jeotgali TaxID=3109030 RepID=UPI002DD944F4|nr:tyrosine-protein phosphatase [Vagococcus sp. B2T-5]